MVTIIFDMRLSDFDYSLPKELISQKPASPRDSSRLLVLDRKSGAIQHKRFCSIGNFLRKGDVVVLNQSKVLPARLLGVKEATGGKVEILLLNQLNQAKSLWGQQWVIIGQPKLSLGQNIVFGQGLEGKIIQDHGYEKVMKFNKKGETLKRAIFKLGQTPIPPYIQSSEKENKLRASYQTVYAKTLGSVAAPTAGLHFTKSLIVKLKKQGVVFKYLTLHVGLGTFQPIKTSAVEKHQMASEWAQIGQKTANFLNQAKQNGHRIIAVGTTATRTLESFCQAGRIKSGQLAKTAKLLAGEKMVDIFIYPGYQFQFVDGLITNFHLPKSTPLLLACAFAGQKLVFKAYQEAIKNRYRFYSFGDAMIVI